MSFQSVMELPKDLEKDLIVLTIFGQKEIHVENHGGILEFTSERICIQYKKRKLAVCGTDLKIEHYDRDEIEIKGLIHEITFI